MFAKYRAAGLCVIPLKNGIPAVKWGQYQDKLPGDISGWERFDEYALVCGKVSGVVALDFDTDDKELIAKIERYACESPVKKIGTKGFTGFYRYNGEKTQSWGGVVEILSDRHLTTIPPSKHREKNICYAWTGEELIGADLPKLPEDFAAFMDSLYPPKAYKLEPIRDYAHGNTTPDEAAELLSFVSPDCSREEWVRVGMALRDEFGDEACGLWHEWSGKSGKYKAQEAQAQWRSFHKTGITIATLYDMAMLNGWKREPVERVERDTSPVDDFVGALQHKVRSKDTTECKFDFDVLGLTGLIGDTVRAMNKYAMYKQPELYLLNTIAAAGAVFGRKYACPMNARTNVYMVGVARTAGGKDFSRQFISNLFEKAGLTEYIGAHYIRSDTGMLVSLKSAPSQVMQLDEFGMYLEALASAKAPLHIKNVSTCLTKLFTSSGAFYDHGATADSKTRIVIQRPNLCIYGTTTEETYASALKRAAIDSGDLNRFLVFKSSRMFTGEEELPPKYEIPDDLIERWEEFSTAARGAIPDIGEIVPSHLTVEWDDKVMAMLRECRIKQNTLINAQTPTSGLWGRYAELVTKIAMIFAISDNGRDPRFSEYHVTIARNIVDVCMGYMVGLANGYVSDNDYEAQQQKIVKFLKTKRTGASMNELHTKFRSIKAKERRDILSDMVAQGVISVEAIRSERGGRAKEIVRLI